MTELTDHLHHDNAPAHSTAHAGFFLVAKHLITQVCQSPYSPYFASCDFWLFPRVKIAIGREEICECDGQKVHKLSQRRLTAD
jgi:hypothetical protein